MKIASLVGNYRLNLQRKGHPPCKVAGLPYAVTGHPRVPCPPLCPGRPGSGPAEPLHCGLPLVTLRIYDLLYLFTFIYLPLVDQIFVFHWANILSYILLHLFQKQLQLYFKQQMFPFALSFLILFLLFIKSLSTALIRVCQRPHTMTVAESVAMMDSLLHVMVPVFLLLFKGRRASSRLMSGFPVFCLSVLELLSSSG